MDPPPLQPQTPILVESTKGHNLIFRIAADC